MAGAILAILFGPGRWISFPGVGLYGLFTIWMLIDAIRRREYLWVFLILAGLSFWYFLYIYRNAPSAMRGFELPGAQSRKRIKELQAQIHHLDKAHHYFQLGDVYFQQGKLDKAEAAYRASLERDAQDIDARAHLGQCLLRQKKAVEARPLLEGVCLENPKHDYGYSMMALAEALTAVGEQNAALEIWQQVTASHSYPRAKVQLAELYIAKNQPDLARAELRDALADDIHAPKYQRRRDRVWVRRAKSVARKLGGV
jgi:tetratricopeptide (TPR) repeat protein